MPQGKKEKHTDPGPEGAEREQLGMVVGEKDTINPDLKKGRKKVTNSCQSVKKWIPEAEKTPPGGTGKANKSLPVKYPRKNTRWQLPPDNIVDPGFRKIQMAKYYTKQIIKKQ